MSIAALVSGCDGRPAASAPEHALPSPGLTNAPSSDVRECHEASSKERLVMDDRVSGDTRIIAVGDVVLFVPVDWLAGYLVDDVETSSVAPNSFGTLIGKFAPDLRRNECPGIVHRLKGGERMSRYGAMALRVSSLPSSVLSPQHQGLPRVRQAIIGVGDAGMPSSAAAVSASSDAGRWTKVRGYPTYKMSDRASAHGPCTATQGTPSSEWVISRYVTPEVRVGLVINVQASEPAPEWATYCEALNPLFRWLTTHPSSRASHN